MNAFVHPTNPQSVFPQIAKPDILDFRSHKMERGGYAASHTFRRHCTPGSVKSKYVSVVRTAEEIEADEAAEATKDQDFEDVEEVEEAAVQAVSAKKSKKNYTIDDIMQIDSKLSISKKKKDAVVEEKSKQIKKKKGPKHTKKSHKIVKF